MLEAGHNPFDVIARSRMSSPVLFALAALLCYGLGDFIYKWAVAAGIRADHFLMAQAWFFCPLVILYALATGTFVFIPAVLWGSLAGIFIFVALYCFVASLTSGTISTNASIFRLNFIVTAALVILVLHEPLGAAKIAGLGFALAATWLLVGGGEKARPGHRQWGGMVQVAIATVLFGAANFFQTVGLRSGALPESLVAAQAALFMPLATAVVAITHRKLPPPPGTFRFAAPAAILLLVATVCMLRGIAGGQASVLVPIAQMGFVIAALLGIFVLREPVTWRKATGLLAAFAALAVLAWS
jgi:drug/metabolite transporter (DMT)-like permease